MLLFPMLQRLLCHLVLLMGAERDSVQLQATQLLSGRQGSGPRPGLAGWYAPLQSPSAEAAEAEDEAWCYKILRDFPGQWGSPLGLQLMGRGT